MPLFPYQEQVYNLLMSGTPVILQAPTGAGKTRAALYPFLRSWEYGEAFPRIVPASFVDGSTPPGTLRIRYAIDLANEPPHPVAERAVTELFTRMASS